MRFSDLNCWDPPCYCLQSLIGYTKQKKPNQKHIQTLNTRRLRRSGGAISMANGYRRGGGRQPFDTTTKTTTNRKPKATNNIKKKKTRHKTELHFYRKVDKQVG